MKSLLVTLQILLICLASASAKESKVVSRLRGNDACPVAFWRPASKVDLYFMRDQFSQDEREAVLDTMRQGEAAAQRSGVPVTFNYAGETDGLIDCENCLTVARQSYALHRRSQTVFNAMRRNDRGNLISAWMGIDVERNSSSRLRGSVLEALRGVRGTKALSGCPR